MLVYIYIHIFVVFVDRAVYNFQNLSITIVEGLAVTMWAAWTCLSMKRYCALLDSIQAAAWLPIDSIVRKEACQALAFAIFVQANSPTEDGWVQIFGYSPLYASHGFSVRLP